MVDGIHLAALLAAAGVSMVILKPKVEVVMEEYMPSNTNTVSKYAWQNNKEIVQQTYAPGGCMLCTDIGQYVNVAS